MNAPAFQFYADDFLAGTSDMTTEEVGAYIRLLCHQWNKGGITADKERLSIMAGECKPSAIAHVMARFVKCEDGLFRNERMEQEREKQRAYREKQSANGKLSAEARASRRETVVKPTPPEPEPIPALTKRLSLARPVLFYLNERAGRSFRETETNLKLIAMRLEEVLDDVEGVKKMIARQVLRWGADPKMAEYLRPETLFCKSKFSSYYDNRELPVTDAPAGNGRPAQPHRNDFIAKHGDDPDPTSTGFE